MRARFEESEYLAAPGESQLMTVRVSNDGPTSASFQLRLVGLDPSLARFPTRIGPVPPGKSVEVPIPVSLPVGFAAGSHEIGIEVVSDQVAQRPVLAKTAITVGSIREVLLSLAPRNVRGAWRGKFQVNISNRGTSPIDLDLAGEGEDLRFKFKHNPVTVRPGESIRIRSQVRGPRPISRQDTARSFTVSASGRSAPVHTVGTFIRRSLLPYKLRTGLAVAMVVLMWALGLFALAQWVIDDSKSGDELASETSTVDVTDGEGDGAGANGAGGDVTDGDGSEEDPDAEFQSTIGGFVKAGETGDDDGIVITLRPVALSTAEDAGVTLVGFEAGDSAGLKTFPGRAALTQDNGSSGPVSETLQSVSDDDGEWGFADIDRRGTYELEFSKAGFDSRAFIVTFPEEGPAELDVTLEPGTGTISGIVIGPDGPIGGADIELTDGAQTWRTSTSTNPGTVGQFVLANLGTPQHYLLTASVESFANDVRAIDLGPAGEANVTIDLVPGVWSVSGTVLSGFEGLGGATVTAANGDFVRTTTTLTEGAPGTFVLPQLPVGNRYLITFEAPGHLTENLALDLEAGQAPLSITLDRSDFVVSGMVVDGDGAPLPATGIIVARDGEEVVLKSTTDAGGKFELTGLGSGTYVLTFSKFQHGSASVLLELTDPTTPPAPLLIELPFDPTEGVIAADGVLVGTIRSSVDNETIAGAVVIVETNTGERFCNLAPNADNSQCNITFNDLLAPNANVGGTEDDGRYTIDGIPVGIHDVTILHPSHQPFADVRAFGIGTRETLNATLLQLGSIRGTVTLGDGSLFPTPFSIVSVLADPAFAGIDGTCSVGGSQNFQVNATDQQPGDGSYDYSETDLVPCHYIVTFAADSYVSTEVPFEIAIGQPGEVTVDAVMRRKPRAALSVFVPTSDPNVFDFESGPTKFNLTTDPAVVASVIVDSPPNIVASVDAATNTFKFEVSVGGTTTEFLPVGPYAIRIIGAPGFTDNSVSFTLLAEQEANIIAPMSPVGKDFGGRIFYETPNGNDKPIPAPNVNIGATQVATGFDEVGGLPAAPFVTQRDDVAQTSTTVGATTTWDPQTLTGLYQVWDTASYAFTHPDFVQNAGAATVAITVIENGDIIAAASPEVDSVNVVGASGSQTVDVELLPLDGNLAGQVSVISVAPSTDVFGATGRVQVTIDGLEDAAAAFTRPVTTVPTVPPTAGLLTGSYTAINQSPGSYTADIQSANIVPVVGGTATSTVVLEPNDQAIFTQLDYYEEGRLIVEVLDQTGAPPPTLIQGATVSLAGTAFTATTGTDGRVSFTGIDVNGVVPLAPRPYTLQVEIDGFQPVTTQVQMLPGGFIDPLVPNTPDADGVFQITLLPLQTITGLVEAINDVGSTTAVPLSGATITYRFFTTADLDPCNATTGFVEDTVTSDGATTGPNFEIAGDEGFYYICEISAPGYTTFVNATPAQLVIGVATPGNETVPAGTFQLLGAPGNIIGKIINDNTSASLPNRELDGNSGRPAAVVCVLPAGFAVTNTPVSTCPVGTLFQDTADNSAEVSFNAIPATGYRLLVFATDHLPLVLDVTVGPGATVDLVDPPDGPIVLKRQKASITATVYAVNTDTGANQVSCTNAKVLGVLPSAAVTITGGDVAGVRGALTTNASGQFTLANLEDGTYDASIDPVDAGFGIVPFAETPVATITDQTDVIRTNLQSNTGNCPVLIPADDGTLSVVLFDDTNGNGVRDGAEGLISTAVAVTVEAFLPTDTVNPEASFNGTAAAGTGLVDNTADLPALSLTAANGTTDPNSPDDRYTIEVSPQTAGAFLSQPVTTEVTPGQLVTVEVGIFVGTRITGILQKQTGDSVTNPITSGDSAALVELFDGTAVSRGTAGPTAFDSSGRWSINVATSVAGAPDYTLVHSNGNNFITTVLSKTEVAALGSPLPGGTLDVGTVTLIERGTLDVSASIAGLTVRLDPLNLGSISPPPGFAVPLQSNGVTPLTALIDDNGTPGNTNDDFTYYELTMGAGQLAAAFKVDPRVNYDVTVSSPTVAPATRADVDVPVGGTTVVSFTLPATGNVVVTVLDPTGASSILDARVALLDAFGDEVANDNNANNSGVYVLNGIDPGTYDIRVTSNDFPDETFAAEVTNLLANETRNVTVTLTGGSITVNVAMLEGGTFPTAGFTLAIAGPTTHPNQTATPGSPNPVFTGLEDDSYTVSVVSPTTGYTYQFTPANARRTITDNNPDQSISLDVTVVRDVSVTLRQPDGLTALTTGTVTLEPGGLALTHTTGGVWTRSDVPIPPAASGDYDVKVLSAYPDETFAGVIDFTAPGAAVTATRTLTGGSVTVRVTTALAAQSYGVELDGATTETATITIAVAATSGEVTFTGLAKDTWTASITSAPAGWQTSTADDDAVVGATATTGSPIIFTAANPAPSVGTATSSEATVNDDPCATAPTSSTITVVNVTDVAGDSLTVTLGWTLGGTADSAAMTQSPTTATTYTGTFDPANFVADVTVTLTVTATDSNGGTDTSTVDVDLVATCPP